MSASRLPGLMGFSNYSTPNDELQFSINAIDGKERPDIGNEAMAWGNTLEPVILEEAGRRLGLERVDTQITVPYRHDAIPLQCSLDGVGYGSGQEIVSDPDRGIVVVGQERIFLDGPGVLEAKVTKVSPEETPHLARGPIQLQGQLLVTGHKWGAVCVLYEGIAMRVFLFAPHPETQKAIIKAVMEFQQKLDKYTRDGEIDWYSPQSSRELDKMFPVAVTKDPVKLPPSVETLASSILASKATIKSAEAGIEECEKQIKQLLGDAERGVAGKYQITWGMRNYKAVPEKLVPAKDAYSVRSSTLTIKETSV